MQGGQSRENFDTGRHGDDHSGRGEIRTRVYIYTNRKYMVSSHYKPQQGDRTYSVDYTQGAKSITFSRVMVNNLPHHAEAGED